MMSSFDSFFDHLLSPYNFCIMFELLFITFYDLKYNNDIKTIIKK